MKYLFTAVYNDGTILQQTQEDISKTNPEKSAFYDVDQTKLEFFGITNVEEDYAIIVDLNSGSFNIKGTLFYAYDKEVVNRRLVYFRRNLIHFNQNQEQTNHEVSYFIGWQGNDPTTGENIQRVLQFN